MDDEQEIRALIKEMLTLLGYEADCVKNGEEAIALYAEAFEHNEPYDAVILDLTVRGGMGGRETMQNMQAIHPLVKAIVSSGYSNDSILSEFKQYGFGAMVAKPYRLEELGSALYTLLNNRS
jgi:CheY-like chemotaxis protein